MNDARSRPPQCSASLAAVGKVLLLRDPVWVVGRIQNLTLHHHRHSLVRRDKGLFDWARSNRMNFEALPAQLREKRERLCRMMARAVPVAGGASGSRSDGLDVFIGVRDRGKVVEVKRWYGTFNFYKEVKGPLAVAALAHDLVRLSENPEYAKDLNVDKVVVCIRKKLDPDWAGTMPLNIGKNLIDKYVREHSLNHSRDTWENLDTNQRNALKDEIVGLAFDFFRVLEEEVSVGCEVCEWQWSRTLLVLLPFGS